MVEPLIRALKEEDSHTRYNAVIALGRIGDVRAVEPLIGALVDPDDRVAYEAVDALLEMKFGGLADALIKFLEMGRDISVRGIRFLGEVGDVRAVGHLIEILRDFWFEDYLCAAAEALGRLGDVRAFEALVEASGSHHESVRAAAAEALGRLGDVRAVGPLTRALDDTFECVWRAAEQALQRIEEKRSISGRS